METSGVSFKGDKCIGLIPVIVLLLLQAGLPFQEQTRHPLAENYKLARNH